MKYFIAILLCLFPLNAFAQSTAEATTPGYLTTSGCPGGQLSCWKPYTSADPLPVSASASSLLCPSCVDGDLLIGNGATGAFALNTLTEGTGITITNGHGTITISTSGGVGVTSFSGDGTFSDNSSSTGAVTLNIKTATAKSLWGNASASTAAPGYQTSPVVSGSMTANTLVSTVSTGAAPLTVSSTTNVANLNTSLLNGASTGTSGATIPLLNGNNTYSGTSLFTGTIPSLANGNASMAASATAGGIIIGQGSVSDLTFENKSGSSICAVATGTTTLNCTGLQVGGVPVSTTTGTVTTTGSPASGNLTKFSGASSITNGDLSGDASTSGTLVVTVSKVNGVSYGTSPSTNTVPVVTGTNTITYEVVPNAALANSSTTIGSTAISLGATSTTLAGLSSVTSTTFVGALTGNASTATALQNARNIGAVSFDGTASIVPQTIQTVDDTSDTTMFVLMGNASGSQTSGQQPKTNSALGFNSTTGQLSATIFSGAGTGLTGTAAGLSIGGNAATATTAGTLTGALSANQVLGSLTAVAPTGQSVPSCSTAASALQWTSGSGFACNTSITAAAVPASGLTGTTLASGVVTTSITSTGALTPGGNLTMSTHDIVTDTSTGTKFGTATSQKIAFFNSTPIVQPSGAIFTALQNLGLVASASLDANSLSGTTLNSGVTASSLTSTGALTPGGNLTMSTHDIVTDTTTGTKFGTATNQKIAFYNSTPIVQPTGAVLTALSNLGLVGTPTLAASALSNGTTGSNAIVLATSATTTTLTNSGDFTISGGNSIIGDGGQLKWGTGGTRIVGSTAATAQLQFNISDGTTQFTVGTSGITALGTATITGTTTGTNADFLCMTAGKLVTLQATACTISSLRFKMNVKNFEGSALEEIAKLQPIVFNMKPMEKPNADPNFLSTQIGLAAENIAAVDPRIAFYENDMQTPKSYRQEGMIALLVKGMQEQQKEINELKKTINAHEYPVASNDNNPWSWLKKMGWMK